MLRDLSGYISDITPAHLAPDELTKISQISLANLPIVEGQPRMGAPISATAKFIAIGLNYRDHAEEAGMQIPSEPIIFMKATSSISGPNDDIVTLWIDKLGTQQQRVVKQ